MRIAVALLACTFSMHAQIAQPTDFEGWRDRGLALLRSGKYGEAVDALQRAADLNPNLAMIHLYLSTVYMQMWVPGARSPENEAYAAHAETEFKRVLELAPNDTTAPASLTKLGYQQAGLLTGEERARKLQEARDWNSRVLQIDPRNKVGHYWGGVLAWTDFYPPLMTARAVAHMKPEDPGPLPPAARADLLSKYGPMVDDGIKDLRFAIEIDPQYDDAMAYLSLLIRERADLRDTPEQYKRDIEEADLWIQRTLVARRERSQRPQNAISPSGHAFENLASFLSGPPPAPPPPPPPPGQVRAQNPNNANPTVSFDPPGAPSSPAVPQRIRVGTVQQANLIHKVDPVCPPLAEQARIRGVVKFTMIIGKDGAVRNVQMISGHPLLAGPALEAVKQWQYKPTLLNGEPVEVITQVDVNMPCGAQ